MAKLYHSRSVPTRTDRDRDRDHDHDHDPANAMATSIATGALRPKVAVLLAGALNLVGAFLSVEVAKTISSGLVDEALISPVVIFAGLVGAIL
jgi:inorganic phosphate transporter, PiT family